MDSLITPKKSLLYGNVDTVGKQAQMTSNQKSGSDRLNALLFTGNPTNYKESQDAKTNNNRLRRLWKNR